MEFCLNVRWITLSNKDTFFLERDAAVILLEINFQRPSTANSIHLHCVEVEAEVSQTSYPYMAKYSEWL